MSSFTDLNFDNSWTLFLDRDGVINKKIDGDYVKAVTEFEWMPGTLDALSILTPLFKTIVIVTNQQGIGKGIMNEKELNDIHEHMLHNVRLHGGRIDAVYFAPWLKDLNHPERKPGIGMAQKAKMDFPKIDFKRSIMAGDSAIDIEFGKFAGMHTVLIGKSIDEIASTPKGIPAEQPDFIFPSLLDFATALRSQLTKPG